MNLIFLLLSTRQFLSKDQIRDAIADYRADSPVAFARKFERDKEELREMGIPVEVGSHDALGGEYGYRISREDAELPDLDLSAEESAMIGLATQVWEHAGMARESSVALMKLKAAGIDVDTSAVRMTEPRLAAHEPAFDAMWDAATQRFAVAFEYAKSGRPAERRRVQPWGILSWHGRWYMAGWDLDRDAARVFRLSRVVGAVEPIGEPGGYQVPEGTRIRDVAAALFGPDPVQSAVLRVRSGRALSLRRTATRVTRRDDGSDEVLVPYGDVRHLAAEIASYGPDIVVMSPDELRAQTIEHLHVALELVS